MDHSHSNSNYISTNRNDITSISMIFKLVSPAKKTSETEFVSSRKPSANVKMRKALLHYKV